MLIASRNPAASDTTKEIIPMRKGRLYECVRRVNDDRLILLFDGRDTHHDRFFLVCATHLNMDFHTHPSPYVLAQRWGKGVLRVEREIRPEDLVLYVSALNKTTILSEIIKDGRKAIRRLLDNDSWLEQAEEDE